ncbi:addiction module antitoxin RelB [Nitrospirillum viridazoti CBAmc]|uniref:Addiction module antitoxin RelB n=2 Tax=Nitrospirillum TaxID=1543705 RepID=A0A248JTD8_9PROT|nr:addiction module antitoxin RelB [Nitrospirillum amazonense CBAmc]
MHPAFEDWLRTLKDKQARQRISIRLIRARLGNFGDCEPVGDGVSEMRIMSGPGYRVYYGRQGKRTYIILGGGEKSTQSRDITVARARFNDMR